MRANIRSEITPFAGARYIVGHKQARACSELMLNFHNARQTPWTGWSATVRIPALNHGKTLYINE